jgi:Tfp pilus assembly protein PilF
LTYALKLNPQYADVYVARAKIYEAQGDSAHAAADYAKAKELSENGP